MWKPGRVEQKGCPGQSEVSRGSQAGGHQLWVGGKGLAIFMTLDSAESRTGYILPSITKLGTRNDAWDQKQFSTR